jgi:hypothetical protein
LIAYILIQCSRGKKVFRRFDREEEQEEEEDIDEQDLGLLGGTADGERRRPMRTLTRKSVKPTRLFQTEEQKSAREREQEEEATTDVEDQASSASPVAEVSVKQIKPTKTAESRDNGKKTSPFDVWGRAKKAAESSRLGKRSATDAFERGSPGAATRVSSKRKAYA